MDTFTKTTIAALGFLSALNGCGANDQHDGIGHLSQKYVSQTPALYAVNPASIYARTISTAHAGGIYQVSSEPFYGSRATLVGTLPSGTMFIAVNDSSVYIKLPNDPNNGPPFYLSARLASTGSYYGSKVTLTGDFNGDRYADLVAINDTNQQVKLFTPGSVSFGTTATWGAGAFYGSRATVTADVNGDYLDDLVAVNDTTVYVRISNGSSFGPPTLWSQGAFYGDQTTVAGDVNLDGRADLVAVNSNSVYVELSSGHNFGPSTWWSTVSTIAPARAFLLTSPLDTVNKGWLLSVQDSAIKALTSDGTKFNPPVQLSSDAFYGGIGTFFGQALISLPE